MRTKTYIDSASLNKERMLKYKTLAVAFSYPDDDFFKTFPELFKEREELYLEYDRLFRSNEIWLYTAEHAAENEFQRAQALSDISGFYKAFGLEADSDRPDGLACELEFMHYLIFKELKAPSHEKSSICLDAESKFFTEHLYPQAKKIAQSVISQSENSFYKKVAKELLEFLESEKKILFNETTLKGSV